MTDQPAEYIPFTMDCDRCEYKPVCFVPLRVANRLARRWVKVCKQGRKRKEYRQQTIGEILTKFDQRKLEAAGKVE